METGKRNQQRNQAKQSNQQPNKKRFVACNTAWEVDRLYGHLPSRYRSQRDGELGDYVLLGDSPKENSRQVVQNTSIPFIPYVSTNNNLLAQVFNALTTSPTNAAIIEKKNRMVVGDGMTVCAKQGIVLKNDTEITDQQLFAINEYLENISQNEGSVIDQLRKVTADFNTFGNAYILITKSTVGSTKRYYQEHIQFAWGRIKKIEQQNWGKATRIGFSQRWDTGEQWPTDLIEYPLYPVFEADKDNPNVERSVLHIKTYTPTFTYYALPTYIASVLHSEMEYRIAKFNQSQFRNGFMPSALIQSFANGASDEEAEQAMLAVHEKYTGTGLNSQVIMQVLSDPSMASKVDILSNQYDGMWTELGTVARDNIITAHEWSPSLVGVTVAGSLGDNQQMRNAFEVVSNTVIRPIQNTIYGQWLNRTLQEAAAFEGKDFGNSELKPLNNNPVSFLGDINVASVLTTDEQREILGYEEVQEEEMTGIDEMTQENDAE